MISVSVKLKIAYGDTTISLLSLTNFPSSVSLSTSVKSIKCPYVSPLETLPFFSFLKDYSNYGAFSFYFKLFEVS